MVRFMRPICINYFIDINAIEEKKKHFEISDKIIFNHTICNYYNNIDFNIIKENLIKKIK